MHRRVATFIRLILLPVGFSTVGCAQAAVATPSPITVTVSGATAMQPVLRALTDEFQRQHPNVLFDLREGGSGLGEERLMHGEIDMAASTLLPGDSTLEQDRGPAAGLIRVPIGIDGVAIVVHPNNPVERLSFTQLRDIYTGQLFDWAEVEGKPGEIVLVSREDGSGTRTLFEERIMGEQSVSLTALVMPSSADMADFVASHPQAIGYVSIAFVAPQLIADSSDNQESHADIGQVDLRVLEIEGTLPTAEDLRTQNYLLVQPLYLITREEPTGWIRHFIDFALGPTGQAIVGRYHVRVR